MPAKRVAILGSTGSIGRSALDVIRAMPHRLEVHALAARDKWQELREQVRVFKPKVVALWFEEAADRLKSALSGTGVKVLAGEAGVEELAAMPENDVVLSAIVGAAGLKPTLAAIRARRTIALANKETIVMAGELVMREASRMGVRILLECMAAAAGQFRV